VKGVLNYVLDQLINLLVLYKAVGVDQCCDKCDNPPITSQTLFQARPCKDAGLRELINRLNSQGITII
jgi:hypothetical protein